VIKDRKSNFRWCAINLYGLANHHFSGMFLQELSELCENEILPFIIRGDFNLIRSESEKNSLHIDRNLIDIFNGFIQDHNLREVSMGRLKYTWSNKQNIPMLVKLDRFLMSTNWEDRFPLCRAWGLTRVGSDHCPFILDSRERRTPRHRYFFFENN
jgi:endonuclease/exonuclease/phosphatase family metal-dependent hydrolase